jgi:NitT/TauT family transport system substrate-binding protein
MRHPLPRRGVLHTGLGALALSAAPGLRKPRAQTLRTLTIDTLASVAAVNIPMQQALAEGLAQIPGYGPANAQHTEHITMVTESVIAGSAEMGDADIIATLAAAEAGADLKIIGLSYNGTSQVIIVNAEKVARIEDLQNPGVSVAVNSIGDFMHVLLIGVLAKRNIDTTKINIVTLGGSNARTRALLAGRVDAVTVHIEQALELMKLGNFKILVKPWDEFPIYFSAGVIATESWLNKPGNAPAAVAYLKAVLTAFRRSNADFPWYGTQFRKLSSSREARAMTDPQIRPGYDILRDQVKAWPDDMGTMTADNFQSLMPLYQRAGVLKGKLDFTKVIDRTYLDMALSEMG